MRKGLVSRALVHIFSFPFGVGLDDITYVITVGKRMSNDYPRMTYDFIGNQTALKWFEKRYGYCDDVWDSKRKYATYLFLSNVVASALTH